MADQQNPIIAINQTKIANRPESYQTMMHVGPKVCITTASHPSFLGFEQLLQIGTSHGRTLRRRYLAKSSPDRA